MWTRSSAGVNPYYLYISNNQADARIENDFPRIFGMTVRCIKDIYMAIFSLWFQPSVGLFKVLKIMTNP
jgi:hypothetical protein